MLASASALRSATARLARGVAGPRLNSCRPRGHGQALDVLSDARFAVYRQWCPCRLGGAPPQASPNITGFARLRLFFSQSFCARCDFSGAYRHPGDRGVTDSVGGLFEALSRRSLRRLCPLPHLLILLDKAERVFDRRLQVPLRFGL